MSKNLRISLYILIPIIIWMISGQFIDDSAPEIKKKNALASVLIAESSAAFYAPIITLNSSATSEKKSPSNGKNFRRGNAAQYFSRSVGK